MAYNNQSLFSDYYLQERMGDHPAWADQDGLEAAFAAAKRLYQEKKDILAQANEAQTEEEFIRPLLREVLEIPYDVQTRATRQGAINRPDYAFFLDQEDKQAAQGLRDDESRFYARAVAVADAKYWRRPLDTGGDPGREQLSNANPSFQIINYLVATGVDWGVLTNGARWRLYYAQARSRVDTYYEVDLAQTLAGDDIKAFAYFYFFFRREAFAHDPHTGVSFLEAVHQGSVDYGVSLQERLKDLIFDQIFLLLATGFLDQATGGGLHNAEADQEQLDQFHQGTLRLLYRLLFLLHAEARDLLPVREPAYGGYSLSRLKHEVADKLDSGATLSGVSTDLWNDLDSLFRIIDRGDPDLNVPRYNGGLFRRDHPNNAFLNQNSIADKYLAPALDLLTREVDPESGQRRFIDYKALDVEQLGSVYEGLLEFHVRLLPGDERDVSPLGESLPTEPESHRSGDLRRSKIDTPLYLINDKGERKATGSYYTPHYIVEYIVENTLGPVLDERVERFGELMDEIVPRRERLDAIQTHLKEDPGRRDAAVTRWKHERAGLRRELKPLEEGALEALLGIRVCDPAMGSGHFLVEAADWLSEHLIAALNHYPGEHNPVLRRLAAIRARILEQMDAEGIAIDRDKLKDTNLLKRMVMKRCLYGVDLNPMAVELAKLSLWLDSFTVGAPLSFLDHHLKVGNSLIGTRVSVVREALRAERKVRSPSKEARKLAVGRGEKPRESIETVQSHLFGGPFAGLLTATELMRDVAIRTDATFAEVTQSAEKYAAFEEEMLPYKRVLDLWVSRHFDNPQAEEFLRYLGGDALQAVIDEDMEIAPKYRRAISRARQLWEEKRFFHWDLEFPEVFIDLQGKDWKENQGFDAVIGNPPYGMTTDQDTKRFVNENYETSEGRDDKYKLFTEQAYKFTQSIGLFSYITSNAMLTNRFDSKLRNLLLTSGTWQQLITFGYPVFDDPTVHSAVFIIQKQKPDPEHNIAVLAGIKNERELQENGRPENQTNYLEDEFNLIAVIEDEKVANLLNKMKQRGQKLGDLAQIRQCIKTGDDEKYLKISHSSQGEQWKRVLGGSDVSRYHIQWPHKFLKYGQWLARNWQNPDFFERPKIIVRETSERITATLDKKNFYLLSTLYSVYFKDDFSGKENLEYLLALFNSELAQFYMYHLVFVLSSGAFIKARTNHYARLPIRRINFTTPADERERLLEEGWELACPWREGQIPAEPFRDSPLMAWLDDRLSADPEQSDVVHDLLARLAETMIALNKTRARLETALDPFKYLDRGAAFVPFPEAFSEEIKYGERVTKTSKVSETFEVSLGNVHHDIDALRLVPLGDDEAAETWELHAQLKLRDPDSGWREWQYEEGGTYIARRWAPVYRFEMDAAKGRYYQHAFAALDEFAQAGSFPGGYTRSTQLKLDLSEVPQFDPDIDLTPLVQLSRELADVRARIAATDRLIDWIVYRLYGLTEEEIAIVEG